MKKLVKSIKILSFPGGFPFFTYFWLYFSSILNLVKNRLSCYYKCMKNAQKSVICCGNIAFDLIASGKGNMVFEARPGGSVFNTAILLGRLGLPAIILAKTGKDLLGKALLDIARKEKLSAKYIFQDKDLQTGLALATLDEKGDSSYVFYKPKADKNAFTPHQVPPSLFKKASLFHTGSAYSYSDFTFNNVIKFLKWSKKNGVFTTYDPNWREGRMNSIRKVRKRIEKILPYISLLKMSEAGALGITGEKTLSGALKKFKVDNIVVTLGVRGSFLWDGKKKTLSPAFKVRTVDTIGAGDGFMAGLIYMYFKKGAEAFTRYKKESLIFASASAALVCRGKGATEGLKSAQAVYKFLKQVYHPAAGKSLD